MTVMSPVVALATVLTACAYVLPTAVGMAGHGIGRPSALGHGAFEATAANSTVSWVYFSKHTVQSSPGEASLSLASCAETSYPCFSATPVASASVLPTWLVIASGVAVTVAVTVTVGVGFAFTGSSPPLPQPVRSVHISAATPRPLRQALPIPETGS
ncbi:hypothetical protein ACWEHT_05035 [Streptomyces sp. NPDC004646]